MITSTVAKTIIITFDTYPVMSMKDIKHLICGVHKGQECNISGLEQERPSAFASKLKNINSKNL